MAMKSGMSLIQRQGIALSPMMRHSLAILRMPTHALADEIAREAEENPFLVVEPQDGRQPAYDYALATTAAPENLLDNLAPPDRPATARPRDRGGRALHCRRVARGRLSRRAAPRSRAARPAPPLDVLEAGSGMAIQRCEPTGIGARDPRRMPRTSARRGRDRTRPCPRRCRPARRFRRGETGRRLARSLGQPLDVLERIATLLRSFGSTPGPRQRPVPSTSRCRSFWWKRARRASSPSRF